MDVLTYLAIGSLAFVVMVWYRRKTKTSFRSPPGPMPLPLVGSLFSINFRKMHLTFAKLAELYGKIFKVSILGKDILVINDITMLRKALQGEEFVHVFADRPDTFAAKYIFFDSDIALGKDNNSVYTLRKMLHKGLKVFGEGVAGFEYQANDELDRLVSELNTHSRKDIDIRPFMKKSFSNWMSSLITGQKAKRSDPKIIWDFNESINILGTGGTFLLTNLLPSLRLLPGKIRIIYKNIIKARDRLLHRFYYSHEDELRDLRKDAGSLLAVLIQMQKENNQQAGYEIVSDIRGLLMDIFFAGLDTTLTALMNSFALLIAYPDCKTKIYFEINRVIGKARPPSLGDRKHMPYTKAFLMEVHRYITIGPLAVPRVCTSDVTFEGYHIKKGTVIYPNLWFIHHDGNYGMIHGTFDQNGFWILMGSCWKQTTTLGKHGFLSHWVEDHVLVKH